MFVVYILFFSLKMLTFAGRMRQCAAPCPNSLFTEMRLILQLLKTESKPIRGLLWLEWAMVVYMVLTTLFIAVTFARLHAPVQMLLGRCQALLMTLALWGAYRLYPCRLSLLCRVAGQMLFLVWWYPDTFELNRIFPNLDAFFARAEQSIFGFQPALVFSETFSSPVVSELLSLGYVSYFPMIVAVAFYYFFFRYEHFLRTSFVIIASFFLFYTIFIALPVAGPQFYYPAVGAEQIAHGVFPWLGDYFYRLPFDVANSEQSLPIPGWSDGLFYRLLTHAHNAGERPTAAFPSSHVGVTTVVLWLAYEARSRRLFFSMLPLAVLMFFATFYIQAHYAIDAVAGLVAGTLMYFLFRRVYSLLTQV